MSDSVTLDYSLPGSFVHGIIQARILKWVAISFFSGSSQHRDQTPVSALTGRFFSSSTTWEAPGTFYMLATILYITFISPFRFHNHRDCISIHIHSLPQFCLYSWSCKDNSPISQTLWTSRMKRWIRASGCCCPGALRSQLLTFSSFWVFTGSDKFLISLSTCHKVFLLLREWDPALGTKSRAAQRCQTNHMTESRDALN